MLKQFAKEIRLCYDNIVKTRYARLDSFRQTLRKLVKKLMTGVQKPRRRINKHYLQLLCMAIPCVIFIVVFSYVPLFGWIYAFFDYKPGLSLAQCNFVGLKYFKLALSGGKELVRTLRNTLVLSGLGLLTTPLPIIFAIMLSEVRSKKFSRLVQTVTTLPNFISWILVFSITYVFCSVDDGLINNVLLRFKLIDQPINYLARADLVWPLQTFLSVWKSMGWTAIIYLAAIAGIDPGLYEAAQVDGANRLQCIWHVTVPCILPTYVVMLLMAVSNILSNGFDQYWMFYNPLLRNQIQVLDVYTYRIGIEQYQFSYSTALGMFKTLISVVLLFIANTTAKKIRGNGIL